MTQMTPASEAQVQQRLVQTPEAQLLLRRLAMRRATILSSLILALALFFLWLPSSSRYLLIISLTANRVLIGLLCLFGLVSTSLLWSAGQRLDIWLFTALNLRGYHALWLDRVMWLATQIGNFGFAALLAVAAYALSDRRFSLSLMLGTLTLWLIVTVMKTFTDRARPFNLLREARVIGLHEPGLSFPSGHTAQTFLVMTFSIRHFEFPLGIALGLYAIAGLVGFTRVYLGVHYPRDVVAGAILGVIWGTAAAVVGQLLW